MNDKEKLERIGNRCVNLAVRHKKELAKFYELFEKIYGIEYPDNGFDCIAESIDYGNCDFSIIKLEDNIRFNIGSCNYDIDGDSLKNIKFDDSFGGKDEQ